MLLKFAIALMGFFAVFTSAAPTEIASLPTSAPVLKDVRQADIPICGSLSYGDGSFPPALYAGPCTNAADGKTFDSVLNQGCWMCVLFYDIDCIGGYSWEGSDDAIQYDVPLSKSYVCMQ